jgi:hypothetical protein
MPATRSLEERFWSKVNKDGPIPTGHPEYDGLGPCWTFNGGTGNSSIALPMAHKRGPDEPKRQLAWRYLWESIHGPIPTGLVIRHKCDGGKPPVLCVNPDHLELGTQADNCDDRYRRRTAPNRPILSSMAEAMIELHALGAPVETIAKAANVEPAAVNHAIYSGRSGVAPKAVRRVPPITPEQLADVDARLMAGATLRQASIATGINYTRLARALAARGTPYTRRPFLNDQELLVAHAMAAEGKSTNAIAVALGKSWPQVRKTLAEHGIGPIFTPTYALGPVGRKGLGGRPSSPFGVLATPA